MTQDFLIVGSEMGGATPATAHAAAHAAGCAGLLRKAGYPIVQSRPFDRRTSLHDSGTARVGASPATNLVETICRVHGHPTLVVVDAPCSGPANVGRGQPGAGGCRMTPPQVAPITRSLSCRGA